MWLYFMEVINLKELKIKLDRLVLKYEMPDFIKDDPISIPHSFSRLQDIEISALFASTIAWGNRTSILKSGELLLSIFEGNPYEFIVKSSDKDFANIKRFYHRTFNGDDALAFAKALRRIYRDENHTSLEELFIAEDVSMFEENNLVEKMDAFRTHFCADFLPHSKKHIGNIKGGSAAKKLNMFLRWMVRPNTRGVDFGLWKTISPSELFLPLDVHSARVSRALGILTRKANDSKAVFEVTNVLKMLCPQDPIKYDFALFAADV